MTNTVFPTFQTQYTSSISHQQAEAEQLGFAKHTEIFQSKDVASD
jgi:hypothetical protein